MAWACAPCRLVARVIGSFAARREVEAMSAMSRDHADGLSSDLAEHGPRPPLAMRINTLSKGG